LAADDYSQGIDSVCIEQADDEEKSEQVMMIDEIFRSASRVTVWLVEREEEIKLAYGIGRPSEMLSGNILVER
jgi:hypothetical protein